MGRNDKGNSAYRPSWDTDVMATMKKHGFKPASEGKRAKKRITNNVRYLTKQIKPTA